MPRPSGRFLSTAIRSRMIVLLELVERELRVAARARRTRRRPRVAGVLRRGPPPRRPSWRPGGRACPRPRSPRRAAAPCEPLICSSRPSSTVRGLDLELRPCRPSRRSSRCAAQSFLISVVGDVERVEDLGLGDLVGAGLDHQDGLVGAGDHEVEVGLERGPPRRVDDEVAVDLADAHRADRRRERDVGDHQRGGGAVHREDVVRVDVVDRQRDRDELRLAAPALGEERADRAVDHAGGEGALLAGAALALEEAAGDLARGVHPLLDVDREREEVDVAQVAGGRGGEHHRVARADDHGAGGLLGQLAGLERDLGAADLDGDPVHFRHMFLSLPALRYAGPSASR